MYIGSVLSSDDTRIMKMLVDNSVYQHLLQQTYSSQLEVIKESLWAMSNITASGSEFIWPFLNGEVLFDRVLTLCENPNPNIMQEAFYVLCNSFTTGKESEWIGLLGKDHFR